MQEQMENTTLSQLFQRGGYWPYPSGPVDLTGVQHIIHTLAGYFQEHGQEELLRISADYVSFSRGQGEAVEEAIARFDICHAVAQAHH
eukprot:8982901-Prorocentrum_lima.AAC.1